MLSRGWGCYGASAVLATLALGSYGANQTREKSSSFLEALTIIFAGLAVAFLMVGTAILVIWAARWIWRYFHTVEVHASQWYCRYWPLQRLLQVYSVPITTGDWAGKVAVSCEVHIGEEDVHFWNIIPEHSHGTLSIEFPQHGVSFPIHPNEGEHAMVRIKAQPSWWRGRPHELMQTVPIGITDHRDESAKRSDDVREAIVALDTLIFRGNQLLEMCGRPDEDYHGAPMFFIEHCLPKMNEFGQEAANTVQRAAPEYIGKLANTGNVTHGDKKASVQQLERWLENIGAIQEDLRKRL
jgi:hypothetical protein